MTCCFIISEIFQSVIRVLTITFNHLLGCPFTTRNEMRFNSLAGAKDMSFVIYAKISNFSIALNGDLTYSALPLLIRHTVGQVCGSCWLSFSITRSSRDAFHPVSAHGGVLAAAIDIISYLGSTLNGDSTIATHQS